MFAKFLPFIFLLAAISSCPFIGQVKNRPTPIINKEDFINQIKRVECDNNDRLRAVERLYKNLGVADEDIKVEKFENVANVVLTVKGKTDEIVVVGGHYDKTTKGCGAIDNWTGVILVANLYLNFKATDNQKTYKFVTFGKEEKNLIGSRAMVENIPESQYKNYCTMVNLDSFGFTNVWALETISDKSMIDLAKEIADERGITFDIKDFGNASSDSKSFQKVNIPSITLSGLGDDWRDYLHQEKDKLEHLDFEKVFENFQFSYDYLNEIDGRLCDSFR